MVPTEEEVREAHIEYLRDHPRRVELLNKSTRGTISGDEMKELRFLNFNLHAERRPDIYTPGSWHLDKEEEVVSSE